MNLTRREFAKANAAAIAAAAAGLPILVRASNLVTEADVTSLVWNKAPCRFCGTGCSVMVATRDGQVVATHGDIKAEVNRGINCVKGYFLSKIMYGSDRLTRPLLRMKDGKFDKQGEFQPISWEQAFDIMAEKFKAALKAKGPESVGMFGSGQWTVWEGYAANKLFKAGLRSNNIDPNARHCMASAVMGFMRSFGMDEPMGCYDDIEATDSFVLWGSNMAEMHPVLWSRVTDRRLSAPQVKVAVLSTFEHRSFELADLPMVFKPQTDLIILNYIANHIIESGAVNRDFVERHVRFAHGAEDIGYGLRPDDPLEKKAKNADKANTWSDIDFKAFAEFVKPYTLERTARESGVPAERLKALAELYADPKRKVVSFWTMGFNQHTRGVWANNLIYNIHLLTGKISEPGNSPFSLTGQPSACGTARGRHLLPPAPRRPGGDQPEAPGNRGEDLEGAGRHHPGEGRLPRRAAEPDAQGRRAQRLLDPGQQQHAGRSQRDAGSAARLAQPGQLRDRLRRLPHRLGPGRRPDPAQRHVGGEGRRLRQCRAPHAVLAPVGEGTGRGEVRPLAVGGVLQALHHRRGLARGTAGEGPRAEGQDPL